MITEVVIQRSVAVGRFIDHDTGTAETDKNLIKKSGWALIAFNKNNISQYIYRISSIDIFLFRYFFKVRNLNLAFHLSVNLPREI